MGDTSCLSLVSSSRLYGTVKDNVLLVMEADEQKVDELQRSEQLELASKVKPLPGGDTGSLDMDVVKIRAATREKGVQFLVNNIDNIEVSSRPQSDCNRLTLGCA